MDTTAAQAIAHSPRSEWSRFVGTLLLVLSPLLLAGTVLEALAWRIGETMPVSMVATWQDGAPDRIWRGGDGHSFLTYKLARVADLKPEIVALGPSRANAFRGNAFAPYSFFNAGLTTWTIDQDKRFLELITRDGYAPRALVITLDYWMFSPGFDHYWGGRFDEKPETHIANLLRVLGQLTTDPADLFRRLGQAGRVHGLYALLGGEGFAADGSFPTKPTTPDAARLAADDTEAGTPPAVFADAMSAEQIGEFDKLVALAKEKHVALIAVQLPLYKKILDGLNDNPDAGIWRQFESAEWQQRLAAAGVVYFDFADMPEYRDKPEYFTDSLDPDPRVAAHISEVVMADPRVRAMLPKAGAPAGK
ncbi:MAG TPA: hypothetical protein VG308_00675 [Stellaceae bacterium]|nr:hypothetical protein [Stellaceae bacterium]